jgi:hypothetical protein
VTGLRFRADLTASAPEERGFLFLSPKERFYSKTPLILGLYSQRMTDEEQSDRLARIEKRLDNLEQNMRRMEQDRFQTQKEKQATKKKYPRRGKSYGHSGQNKAHTGPKFKGGKSYPRP